MNNIIHIYILCMCIHNIRGSTGHISNKNTNIRRGANQQKYASFHIHVFDYIFRIERWYIKQIEKNDYNNERLLLVFINAALQTLYLMK